MPFDGAARASTQHVANYDVAHNTIGSTRSLFQIQPDASFEGCDVVPGKGLGMLARKTRMTPRPEKV